MKFFAATITSTCYFFCLDRNEFCWYIHHIQMVQMYLTGYSICMFFFSNIPWLYNLIAINAGKHIIAMYPVSVYYILVKLRNSLVYTFVMVMEIQFGFQSLGILTTRNGPKSEWTLALWFLPIFDWLFNDHNFINTSPYQSRKHHKSGSLQAD